MFKAKFRIKHKGCWGPPLSQAFPAFKFLIPWNIRFKDGSVGDMLHVSGEPSKLDNVVKFLESYKTIRQVEIMERGQDYLILNVVTDSDKSISKKIYDSKCFIISPIEFDGPDEFWTIGSASREHLNDLFQKLKTVGEARLLSMREIGFGTDRLTSQQKKALEAAISNGYYQFPRGISATALAKKLNLAKATLLEHLRKAEAKIITDYGRYK